MSVIENLLALQTLQLKRSSKREAKSLTAEQNALRAEIPEQYLQRFDRLMQRKRKALSIVRRGVCGECHLQLATGVFAGLAFADEVQQCGNCGRFLYLPADEPVFGSEVATKPKSAAPRREAAAAV